MAEIGLVGSIVGIPSAGIKLSITLYSFSETVSTAHSEIKNIARDVSLTSAVLEELGASLKQDDQAKLYSGSALRTAKEVVKECEGVFNDINYVMGKAMDSTSKRGIKKGKLALTAIERLRWPFLQPKMEMLRGNLERLKSTLLLMLNVLSYARDLRIERKKYPKEDEGYQRMLLESLLRANQEATRNYEALLKTIGPKGGNEETSGTSRLFDSEALAVGGEEIVLTLSPILPLAKSSFSDQDLTLSNIVEDSGLQEFEVESTIKACIANIENALIEFEQSDTTSEKCSLISVRIDVQKDSINSIQEARNLPAPWTVMSIARMDEGPGQATVDRSSAGKSSLNAVSVGSRVVDASGISTSQNGSSTDDSNPAEFESQIEAVASMMKENLELAAIFGERLDTQNSLLPEETHSLAASSQAFRRAREVTPWHTKAWNSLPSASDIVNPIQQSLPSPTATMAYLWETLQSTMRSSGVVGETENTGSVRRLKEDAAQETDPEALRQFRTLKFKESMSTALSGGVLDLEDDPSASFVLKESPTLQDAPSRASKEVGDLEDSGDATEALQRLLERWTTLFDGDQTETTGLGEDLG